jgi:D-xylono/L-arabinono-1,4-lactonase
MQPEIIADFQCNTGEGPLWHPLEKRVYWTDIPNGKLFRYDPATGHHEQCYAGDPVGGFTIQSDGALLLFGERGSVASWRGGASQYMIRELPAECEARFNDVIADPEGRVFCGTMSNDRSRSGRLYRLDLDGRATQVLDGIGISNGMGFTLDHKQMYFTDSPARKIYVFDYDRANGALSNQRVFVETPEGEGFPDGMTVDAAGYVWSARWDGSALYRYAPDGVMVQRIAFPAKKVSSITFGGDDYSDMYVTTALDGHSKAEEGEGAGALFRLRAGVRGVPEFFSRVRL